MTALFMKIDSSSDGEINWDEFCTYMQLEYAEKEESNFRAKEVSSQKQTSSKSARRLRLNIFFTDSELCYLSVFVFDFIEAFEALREKYLIMKRIIITMIISQ